MRADLFTRGRRVRDKATSSTYVATALREVILTFGLIRFTPTSGGSDDPGEVRSALQTLLSFGTVAICVGPSHGSLCDACGRSIAPGGAQYEATTDERGMHLDNECFDVLMDEIARTRWPRQRIT